MTANVESMFYAGQVPWHGIGKQVATEITGDEAMKSSGLDWTVGKVPLFALGEEVEGHYALVRSSDAKTLGVVGEGYRVFQNEELVKVIDALIGQGGAHYHTAGSLGGGRMVWFLAKLSGNIRIGKDDITEKYLLFTNSHDGHRAAVLKFTPVRVVCQNTLNLALSTAGESLVIRHTASAEQRIEEAKRTLGFARDFYAKFERTAHQLGTAKYSMKQMSNLAVKLFPAKEDEPSKALTAKRDRVIELFEYGKGHYAIKGTAWAALNAVAEFADHDIRTRGDDDKTKLEARAKSIWFGSAMALKQRAYDVIVEQIAA